MGSAKDVLAGLWRIEHSWSCWLKEPVPCGINLTDALQLRQIMRLFAKVVVDSARRPCQDPSKLGIADPRSIENGCLDRLNWVQASILNELEPGTRDVLIDSMYFKSCRVTLVDVCLRKNRASQSCYCMLAMNIHKFILCIPQGRARYRLVTG